MSECLSSTLLDALARGILNSAERDQAEAHLLSCADCRRSYALIQSDSTTAPGVDQDATTIDMVAAGAAGPPPRDPHPRAPNIPGYAVLDIIAQGGQGDVYRALQLSTQRTVALKVLLGTKPTPAQQIRFQR
jgi:serine/threonine protein kinase